MNAEMTLTAANTPIDLLKWKAKAFRQMMPDMKFIFAEWLLEQGEAFGPSVKKPKGVRLGKKKMCYQNSIQALLYEAVDPDEWFYTEGVVFRKDLPIEIGHAWLSNRKGEVIDLTLRDQDAADQYFGVPFKWSYVKDKTFEHGYYGLFSNGMTYNQDVADTVEEGRAWKKGER